MENCNFNGFFKYLAVMIASTVSSAFSSHLTISGTELKEIFLCGLRDSNYYRNEKFNGPR